MRIGMGYDVHRLVEGRDLILGGVNIPFEKGLLGHSDADVVLHAIMDALLGAAALGDIGQHFPDTDPAYAGADSMELLRHVAALIHEKGYTVGNLDATILCQDFPFVRVDFFLANGTYYFAELTFTPSAGMMPFNPDKYDLEWGQQLDIIGEMMKYEKT